MKRRTKQARKRRERKSGMAPYTKYNKQPYKYTIAAMDAAQTRIRKENAKELDRIRDAHGIRSPVNTDSTFRR